MKSFFKKLAFVMALAMVVSSVAPAAANAAEETEVIFVPQTGEAIETQLIVFTEGDEPQDFRFLNAPANWRETYKWTTVDPTIATVDTSGVVTPVAVGQTMLQLWIGGEVVAQAKILVNPVSKVDEFALTQKSATQLTATFVEASKLDVTKDFQLYIVYPQEGAEDIVVKWPAAVAFDDAKKVATITPTIALGHGDHYRLVAGSYTQDVTTKIDKVDELKLSLPTTVGRNFYVDTEYSIVPSFLADGVDLTSLYIDKYDVVYDVQLVDDKKFTNDDFEWDVNDDTLALEITIYEEGLELAIGAKLVDEKENPITTATASVLGTAKPAWSFNGKVVDWAIIKDGACCVDWDVKSIPADLSPKGEYSIVLKFKDGDGKTYVTHPKAVQEGTLGHAGNYNHGKEENIYINRDLKNNPDKLTAEGYEVYLYSTDNNLMLIDETTGELGVYTPATVSFYVKLVHYNAVTDEETERYIYANEVEITEETKLDDVYQKTAGTINVVKEVLPGEDSSKMSKEVAFVIEDQYGEPWGQYKLFAYYLDKDGKKVYITDEEGQTSSKITFNSTQFEKATSSEVKVTVEAVSTALFATEKDSTTVTVKITSPNYEYNDKGVATGIKLDTVTKNRYYNYADVLVKGGTTDVKLADNATNYQVSGTISLYKLSNGVEVGLWRQNDDYVDVNVDAEGNKLYSEDWVAIRDEDHLKDMTEEGSKYVVMRDPSGKIVELNWHASGDKLEYKLNKAIDVDGDLTADQLVYAAEGAYTVEAVIVRYNNRNGNSSNIVRNGSVTVKDTTKDYYIKEATKNTFSGAECKVDGKIDVNAVIMDVFKFGYDNAETDKVKESWIAKDGVKAVVLNDAVILQYVVLHVPVANTGLYYELPLEFGNKYLTNDGTVAK